jgi:hypothetical protein
MSSTTFTTYVGMASVAALSSVALGLAVTAVAQGRAHAMRWAPNVDALGHSFVQVRAALRRRGDVPSNICKPGSSASSRLRSQLYTPVWSELEL